jgi:3D (Asp-Asp-Asp) domain-containing protein
MRTFHAVSLGVSIFVVGCSQDASQLKNGTALRGKASLHKLVQVKTTAYCHTERAHRRYGKSNAVDGRLASAELNSAAADWSRFPVGTKFRIVGSDRLYVVDDYGSALVGTNTIDLYMPSRREMVGWGARRVTIELLEVGSYQQSLKILKPRCRIAYVRRMVRDLQTEI